MYNTVYQTCQRLQDEMARLAVLKTELHCSDEMASQWISEVNEWAAGGKQHQITEINSMVYNQMAFTCRPKQTLTFSVVCSAILNSL